ncbi:MAG: TfoX/Sxy family protein [Alphaproteobacteria bacterium]|nr:TfoX/Sxy family protein [Alphaproteobacteria bacterium]
MAEIYLKELQNLLAQTASGRDGTVEIEARHFLGGAAAYADGRIFISLTPAGLALKLPEDDRAALLEQGATPLRYFPKAPIKKAYVVVPQAIADDCPALAGWVEKSIGYVLTMPKPRPKSGGR